MAQDKEIKNRIKTVKNISKVTKTMQMVSAVRMKRAIKRSVESQPYAEGLSLVVNALGTLADYTSPLTKKVNEVKSIWFVVIGPSKGFVGALVSKLTVEISDQISKIKKDFPNVSIQGISVNKLALKILSNIGVKSTFHFTESTDSKEFVSSQTLIELLKQKFSGGEADIVYLVYPKFISPTKQTVSFEMLLPINLSFLRNDKENNDYTQIKFEPNAAKVVDFILEEYFEKQVRNALLSESASEHSQRMISMKNATDNAFDLIDKLTLYYNKSRQQQITQQVNEVSSSL